MSFASDIEKFSKEIGATVDEASRAIKIELFSSIILDTRVDTGLLRGNWQTTVGSPNYSTIERKGDKDIDAAIVINEVVNTVQGDTVDYMTNNLPYAEVWEEEDGMVAKNMVRIPRIIKEVVKESK